MRGYAAQWLIDGEIVLVFLCLCLIGFALDHLGGNNRAIGELSAYAVSGLLILTNPLRHDVSCSLQGFFSFLCLLAFRL